MKKVIVICFWKLLSIYLWSLSCLFHIFILESTLLIPSRFLWVPQIIQWKTATSLYKVIAICAQHGARVLISGCRAEWSWCSLPYLLECGNITKMKLWEILFYFTFSAFQPQFSFTPLFPVPPDHLPSPPDPLLFHCLSEQSRPPRAINWAQYVYF